MSVEHVTETVLRILTEWDISWTDDVEDDIKKL